MAPHRMLTQQSSSSLTGQWAAASWCLLLRTLYQTRRQWISWSWSYRCLCCHLGAQNQTQVLLTAQPVLQLSFAVSKQRLRYSRVASNKLCCQDLPWTPDLLTLPPECSDFRCVLPCLALELFLVKVIELSLKYYYIIRNAVRLLFLMYVQRKHSLYFIKECSL